MIGICDLPPELLVEVLRRLDISSIKEARLACRQWAETGAGCLPHRVYYAPRHDRIDVFNSISENTPFAANFTELVYDARMFHDAVLEGYRNYYWEDHHPSEEMFQKSREQYKSYLQLQTSILDTGRDFDTLRMGLKRLPNLRQISILGRFRDAVYFRPFIPTPHEWYRSWLLRQFKGIVEPSQLGELDRGSVWDCRGIENLFKAVASHAPKLHNLILDCEAEILSTTIYSGPKPTAPLKTIIPRLRKFRTTCETRESLDEEEIITQRSRDITSLLYESPQLNEIIFYLDRSFILKGRWSHLRVLTLIYGLLDLPNLRDFSQFHAEVLRELRLCNVQLRGVNSWEEVAEKLGRYWRLDMLLLSGLTDGTEPEQIDDLRRLESIARSFMVRISYEDLEVATNRRAVIAWHKQNQVFISEFQNSFYHL
ncbi:MAG: hypothetical protein HETSPECPRED_009835 [Heterodermia speciosa]|uniref:F-box domain-containing protein n=1 Tax=Heterodermia speciosa TaxID=116794 RepID=A0A8H3IWI5_9LECA|nr:MAG: hypothetical protein HETSPECPRED_009835 [Heterodermia speciosa]